MRIATWNVNSAKARMPRLTDWLQRRSPDVLVLQETKLTDEQWPSDEFAELGYESRHHGAGRWNGVAVLSRVGIDDVVLDLPGQPEFEGAVETRAIGATCGGVRVWGLYVPNGRSIGHAHYDYKLAFLDAVRTQVAAERTVLGEDFPYLVMGDFNVAPRDDDVWDIAAFDGLTHVTVPEREAVLAIQRATDDELLDLIPRASADPDDARPPYSFWEMRMLGFQKGRGMRIDLALADPAVAGRVADVWIDRDARKGTGPSDHAPVVVDLALA